MSQSSEVQESNANAYAAVVHSFVRGLVRVNSARAAHLTFTLALAKYQSAPSKLPDGHQLMPVLTEIASVSFGEHDAYGYLGNFGHLVYATTLFDSFVTDTTRLLFLMFPRSIGKSQGVTIDDIVSAKSTTDLLHAAVEKRVRDMSYKSFLERIKFWKTSMASLSIWMMKVGEASNTTRVSAT